MNKHVHIAPKIRELTLERSKDGTTTLFVDLIEKQYRIHNQDGLYEYESISEFKLDGNSIFSRIIEEYSSNLQTGTHYNIRDGVVTESEYRERHVTLFQPLEIEKQIAALRESTVWHPENQYIIRYFLISLHPDQFSSHEYRHNVRSEIENFKIALANTIETAKRLGCCFEDTENGGSIKFPDDSSRTRILSQLNELAAKDQNFTTLSKILYSKKILKELELLLERKFDQIAEES